MPLATFAPGQTWGQDVLLTSPREREGDRNAQATKGCRGTSSRLAVRTGPILVFPGDRRREAAQGGFRTSVRSSSTGIDELRLAGAGGRRRGRKDLEGEPSPWETRAMDHWKRWHVATDSSAEQGLEVGRSHGGCRTPNPATGEARDTDTPMRGRGEVVQLRQGHRHSSLLDHPVDVGVRFGGSEHRLDPGNGPLARPPASAGKSSPLCLGCPRAVHAVRATVARLQAACFGRQPAPVPGDRPTTSVGSRPSSSRPPIVSGFGR
jgi:hypothetical protein